VDLEERREMARHPVRLSDAETDAGKKPPTVILPSLSLVSVSEKLLDFICVDLSLAVGGGEVRRGAEITKRAASFFLLFFFSSAAVSSLTHLCDFFLRPRPAQKNHPPLIIILEPHLSLSPLAEVETHQPPTSSSSLFSFYFLFQSRPQRRQ
jgi:hypothetical protein